MVPSPYPLDIVESNAIRLLLASGCIVIAAGGGGIPVVQEDDGTLEGVDCVVDKDLSSMVLARDVGADVLVMLTAVDAVYRDFGTPEEAPVPSMSVIEAREMLDAGVFPAGSMAPKVRAAVEFIETGGRAAFIGSGDDIGPILEGMAGTRFHA